MGLSVSVKVSPYRRFAHLLETHSAFLYELQVYFHEDPVLSKLIGLLRGYTQTLIITIHDKARRDEQTD